MKITADEFEQTVLEGQEMVYNILANDPEVSAKQFYKVVDTMEYLNVFLSMLYVVSRMEEK
jgi:hypothetical protein